MTKITEFRFQAAAEAAQRLVLATNSYIEYLSCEDYEHDVELVVALLEESRDACWPTLEERARQKAKADAG